MRLIVLVLAGLLLSACGLLDGDFLESEVQTAQDVENFIGQSLPTSSSDFQYEILGFTDMFVRLRFTAPAADVTPFLEALGFSSLTTGGDPATYLQSSDLEWWHPETATTFVTGAHARPEVNRFYRVLVDQTAGDIWTVYLIAFSQ